MIIKSSREVRRRFCRLNEEVGEALRFAFPSDCFCGDVKATEHPDWKYRYDERVLRFIEVAVRRAIKALPKARKDE